MRSTTVHQENSKHYKVEKSNKRGMELTTSALQQPTGGRTYTKKASTTHMSTKGNMIAAIETWEASVLIGPTEAIGSLYDR